MKSKKSRLALWITIALAIAAIAMIAVKVARKFAQKKAELEADTDEDADLIEEPETAEADDAPATEEQA